MFTGIIQATGLIAAIEPRAGDVRLRIACGDLDLSSVTPGDSIAVSGVCLTAVAMDEGGFSADVSTETLQCTTLGELAAGDAVNLEKPLLPATPLGGHFVSGHVDGVGEVIDLVEDARSLRIHIQAPQALARYIAAKGSVCVDGVSLTVNEVNGAQFGVNIIPHTLEHTTIGQYRAGSRVNIEVDLIARYLERLYMGARAADPASSITREFLANHGYLDQTDS